MRMFLLLGAAVAGMALFVGAASAQEDCNDNGIPDECDISCFPEGCDEFERCGLAPDCNGNEIPDECEGEEFQFGSGRIDLPIPDDDPDGVSHTIEVETEGNVTHVHIHVSILHTAIGDLTIDVEHKGISVRLWDSSCGENDDLNIIFDDDGEPVVCATPTVGRFQPVQGLDAFANGDLFGDWTLTVRDNNPEDIGTLVRWGISGTLRNFDCCVGDVVESDPPDGIIDAREEHLEFEPEVLTGLDAFFVTFDDSTSVVRQCFSVTETGGGEPIQIASVRKFGENQIQISFDRPLTVQEWTTLTYQPLGGEAVKIDVAFLPGDVNQSRKSTGSDISDLIDCLDSGRCSDIETDINRSGEANGSDIVDLIDLLTETNKYPRVWLNEEIGPEPNP